ncbi:biotin/lipoyl-containing protein [Roseivivax isoporae]|uniref:Pyruvate dehydrogenase n=1 Tax=Roseivivax isoporae LMG 25204 TaxID=1449351 RepID=X7F9D0_9RHOB|nr:biotin/lipoyl-containing protein [Roseivivax isoporae]ETX29405.1 pyruvate dehydrogenase [Roseivivax isoporae LMG 25204]
MPHEVTMPQLGMAQDAGRLVAWLKRPGEAVRKGDALFEVETDKATMEVEAQRDGYLTGVAAAEGDDVPVGRVIARITDSAEEEAPAAASPAEAETAGADATAGTPDDLPDGRAVTMPQLGMAQDAGLLVTWSVTLGDRVGPDDTLFEVETDKSTMEVPAGAAGYLAATLAEPGEEVPVGQPVAILTEDAPGRTVARSRAEAPAPAAAAAPAAAPEDAPAPDTCRVPAAAAASARGASGDRILASPKARRLALERGLDLQRLVDAGHPQPFHVRDLEALAALPAPSAAPAAAPAAAMLRLTAETRADGVPAFAGWAAATCGLDDARALLAGFAGAGFGADGVVHVEVRDLAGTACYAVPPTRRLGEVRAAEAAPDLVLRDLRATRLSGLETGPGAAPVLTLLSGGAGVVLTLEAAAGQIDPQDAIRLLSDFAGRIEDPMRHLL